jgi:glycosyltransferase involved in cell wall biosynthesis
MGVDDPGFVSPEPSGSTRRLVSCSRFVAVKRVDRILAGIDRAARRRPDLHIEWHHFGDGELRESIACQARTTLPANAVAELAGYSSRSDLLNFYRSHPIDAFLNASESEGTPIAIMEAVSCGIPVIATAVGGNPEIVSDENGVLVGPEGSPEEIADAVLYLIDDPAAASAKRVGSRSVWATRYDAHANYRAFAARLCAIRDPA